MSSDKKVKKENFNFGTITDIQGNSYRTINVKGGVLGADQEWFADNLNVSCFRNGDAIEQAQEYNDWIEACEKGIPAWCYYEENQNFGKIYNLAAIMDPRGLAPEGYKIPDYIDFSILGFNAQEYEPLDKNVFSYVNNYRLEGIGLSSGALKLMSKEFWKKKGKNTCGMDIIGGGFRSGYGLNNGFNHLNEACYLWLKPSGWDFIDNESDKQLGWIEFNNLKLYLPEFSISKEDIYNAVVSNGFIKINASDFDVYEKKMISNGLQVDRDLLGKLYPFKKKDETHSMYYNNAISCLFDYFQTGSRNGIRVAAFSSGKNQIWYSIAQRTYGAYVRPFKYA
jgi:uncharacterized protein (TIGR02145 family)